MKSILTSQPIALIMGSNQSKPEEQKPSKPGEKKHDDSTDQTVNATNNHVPPTATIDYGMSASFANTGGIHSLPITPITPFSTTMPELHPATSAPQIHVQVHELDGHSNITRPPPPPRLRHLSELIDPEDIPRNSHVRSPSGNVLGAAEYAAHPDRPLSMRERRKEILKRVRAASAGAEGAIEGAGNEAAPASAPQKESVKSAVKTEGGAKEVKFRAEDTKKAEKGGQKIDKQEKEEAWWKRLCC